jgi:16S rRNA (uracil1498-N3)-methyltransferase
MTSMWLFSEHVGELGERVALDAEESRHAMGSRRLQDGDMVTLFDGAGAMARGTLQKPRSKRHEATVEIQTREWCEAPRPWIGVGYAVPKGDRHATLIDMATQVGADRLAPLAFERAVGRADEEKASRWRRIAIEACKQARRAWLPTLASASGPREFLVAVRAAGGVVLAADPAGDSLLTVARAPEIQSADGVAVLIGPEGGMTPAERELLRSGGATPVNLGPFIQRIETAAVSASAGLVMALRRGRDETLSRDALEPA